MAKQRTVEGQQKRKSRLAEMGSLLPQTVVFYSSLDSRIRKAQMEAAVATSTCSTEAGLPSVQGRVFEPGHSSRSSEWTNSRKALETLSSGCRDNTTVANAPLKISPMDLVGHWSDSLGHNVHVHWACIAYGVNLMATLSRAAKPDIHLSVWQNGETGEWHCGNAKLVLAADSWKNGQITWIFNDGRVSVWTWQADISSALSTLQSGSLAVGGSQPFATSTECLEKTHVFVPFSEFDENMLCYTLPYSDIAF